jgi:hypothetical protein
MDEDDYTSEPLPATPMQGLDVVILALDSFQSFLGDLTLMLCKHANYRVANKQFAREAGMAIERIVSGE